MVKDAVFGTRRIKFRFEQMNMRLDLPVILSTSAGYRVSCLDGREGGSIISGSYAGNVRVWTGADILSTPLFTRLCAASAFP